MLTRSRHLRWHAPQGLRSALFPFSRVFPCGFIVCVGRKCRPPRPRPAVPSLRSRPLPSIPPEANSSASSPSSPWSVSVEETNGALRCHCRSAVDRRCDRVQSAAEAAAMSLESAFTVQMAKLPKSIRQMKMKDFLEQFGGDIRQAMGFRLPAALPASTVARAAGPVSRVGLATVKRVDGTAVRRPRPAAGAVGRPPLAGAPSANTDAPLPPKGTRLPMATPSRSGGGVADPRMARPDEVLLSVNGSPVRRPDNAPPPSALPLTAVRATVGRSRTAVGRTAPPAEDIAIDVALADGRAISLASSDIPSTLSDAEKLAARERLLALQSQVSAILSKL
jgi:hypothetical protein